MDEVMTEITTEILAEEEQNIFMPPKFIHLRVHSDFSTCDGI